MNILIVGCSRVGSNLARLLDEEGHEISVLAETQADLDRLADMGEYVFSGVGFVGIPVDIENLRNAGIQSVDAVACVTGNDNINIMVAQIAEAMFHVPKVLCRVADPVMKEVFSEQFGLQVICPTNLTVETFAESLLEGGDMPGISFGCNTLGFVQTAPSTRLVGTPLLKLRGEAGRRLVGAIGANGVLRLAGEDVVLQEGDKLLWAQQID